MNDKDARDLRTDGGQEDAGMYRCDDCDEPLKLVYDERDDEDTPVVCGSCGGTNTRKVEGSA